MDVIFVTDDVVPIWGDFSWLHLKNLDINQMKITRKVFTDNQKAQTILLFQIQLVRNNPETMLLCRSEP